MADTAKKEIKNENVSKENSKQETKKTGVKNDKKINESNVVTSIKSSFELSKDEINKLDKFNCKIVKRYNKKYRSHSYRLFFKLSQHVTPSVSLSELDYHLLIDELKESNYITKEDKNKDIETIFVKDVPVRLYHVSKPETDTDYSKFNIFMTKNCIYTQYFKFAEIVLLKKENPNVKFILVGDDNDLTEAEKNRKREQGELVDDFTF